MPITANGLDDSDDDDEVGECPECGVEVYLIATRCPKCGHWFQDDERRSMNRSRQTRSELKIVKVGGVVLLVLFAVAAVVAVIATL
jgi:uncharacterized membrane protein YvbJ